MGHELAPLVIPNVALKVIVNFETSSFPLSKIEIRTCLCNLHAEYDNLILTFQHKNRDWKISNRTEKQFQHRSLFTLNAKDEGYSDTRGKKRKMSQRSSWRKFSPFSAGRTEGASRMVASETLEACTGKRSTVLKGETGRSPCSVPRHWPRV